MATWTVSEVEEALRNLPEIELPAEAQARIRARLEREASILRDKALIAQKPTNHEAESGDILFA